MLGLQRGTHTLTRLLTISLLLFLTGKFQI